MRAFTQCVNLSIALFVPSSDPPTQLQTAERILSVQGCLHSSPSPALQHSSTPPLLSVFRALPSHSRERRALCTTVCNVHKGLKLVASGGMGGVKLAKLSQLPLGVVWALCLDNTDVWADAIWGSENKTGCGGAALRSSIR